MSNIVDLDEVFIKDLGLSRRTFNALNRSGVITVGKLRELLHTNKLENIYFIGDKSLEEISNVLEKLHKYPLENVQIEKALDDRLAPNLFTDGLTEEMNSMSVEILGLRPSIKGSLIKNGVRMIGDLRSITDEILLNINHIGPKMLLEIRQALKSVLDEPHRYGTKIVSLEKDSPRQEILVQSTNEIVNWAKIVQDFFSD